jgi:hypothetical protein
MNDYDQYVIELKSRKNKILEKLNSLNNEKTISDSLNFENNNLFVPDFSLINEKLTNLQNKVNLSLEEKNIEWIKSNLIKLKSEQLNRFFVSKNDLKNFDQIPDLINRIYDLFTDNHEHLEHPDLLIYDQVLNAINQNLKNSFDSITKLECKINQNL